MNIQDLKEKSINVTNETITYSPVYSKELTIDMSEIGAHYIGCYAVNNATINNSTICFVTGDSEVFVCPYTREARRVLEEEGYVLNYFYVPFSCGEIPKNEAERWQALREEATKIAFNEFASECIRYCNRHGVHAISDESLSSCLRIPREGITVKKLFKKRQIFPLIDTTSLTQDVVELLGKYSISSGVCCFVYIDSSTYVVPGYWMIDELRKAGFKRGDFYVPLSGGETIVDPSFAAHWESIKR